MDKQNSIGSVCPSLQSLEIDKTSSIHAFVCLKVSMYIIIWREGGPSWLCSVVGHLIINMIFLQYTHTHILFRATQVQKVCCVTVGDQVCQSCSSTVKKE